MTPRSLYLITAYLIKFNIILLEDIYPHLNPTDTEM